MRLAAPLSLIALAACTSGTSPANSADETVHDASDRPFAVTEMGDFDEPWAADFMPGTDLLFVTGKGGTVEFVDVGTDRRGSIQSGLPEVDYGGQGGLGDIAFAPSWSKGATSGPLYLTWVEPGEGDTRGAVLGRGQLVCEEADACQLEGLRVLWRQDKVTGRGHFSHRIAFSPDGQTLFLTSGERQKMDPAQDRTNNLGGVLRLTLDGQPAPGNPWADEGGRAAELWSYGHRNLLGIDFAPDGRLWEAEMGPKGGDEINLIEPGRNYGWPEVSNGSHYDGRDIPDHAAGDGFESPKYWWNPSISPGAMRIYKGDLFPGWKGDALVGALSGEAFMRVDIEGDRVVKADRWPMDARIRAVLEGPDGAIYLLEDGGSGSLLKLTPAG